MAMLEIVNLTIGASLAGLLPYTPRESGLKRIDAKLQKYCSILKICIGLGAQQTNIKSSIGSVKLLMTKA